MSTVPAFPLMTDGTLPPLPFLLRWLSQQARQGVTSLRLDRLPSSNGSLPDLLIDAGILTLHLERNPVGKTFRWEGWSGGRITVNAPAIVNVHADGAHADGAHVPTEVALPLHHGELPCSARDGTIDPVVTGLIDLARLEDANAATNAGGPGHGAAWEHLLTIFSPDSALQPPRVPPLAGHAAALTDGRMGAWNPLAMARRCVVALPAPSGTPPWGLIDQHGARYPVQVVEGPIGRELLTSVTLGALEAMTFEPHDDPVAGSHWEVSRLVIDNGHVRAELDPLGQIVRLCCDGRFVDWSGPGLQVLVDDLPLAGPTTTTVLEDGPIRGRIAVTRVSTRGTLHLTYTVHAHEAVLRVSATWDGDGELRLECPTVVRAAALQVGAELGSWSIPQHADLTQESAPPTVGLRWAQLSDHDRRGLAVIGLRPLTVSSRAGRLSVHVERIASFALCESALPTQSSSIGQLAVSLATPARAAAAAIPATLRVVGDHSIPWWISRPDGWLGELILGHQHGQRSRSTLFISAGKEAYRAHADGRLNPLRRTADNDGFEIDLAAKECAIIRWR